MITNSGGVMTICDNGASGDGAVLYYGENTTSCVVKNDGFLEVKGGRFQCREYIEEGVELEHSSIITVADPGQTNRLLIRGGTFESTVRSEDSTETEVSGGNFSMPIVKEGNSSRVSIRGGVYHSDPSRYLASGYTAVKDGTKWRIVAEEDASGEWLMGVRGWDSFFSSTSKTHYHDLLNGRIENSTLQLNALGGEYSYALLFADMDRVEVGDSNLLSSMQLDLNGQTVKVLDCENYDGSIPVTICAPGRIGSIVNFAYGLTTVKKVGVGDIMIPENYKWGSDGTLIKLVAKVNGESYSTFEAAQENANGATITLLNTPEHRVRIKKDITVDLNTYSLFPVVEKGVTLTLTGIGSLSNALIATENAMIDKSYKILDQLITLPDGYVWQNNKVILPAPIQLSSASYGEKFCGSLVLALEATNAAEWTTYTLTCPQGIWKDVVIAAEKDIILDLNGYSITAVSNEAVSVFENYGRLIIRDSAGKGRMEGAAYAVTNRGLLGVESGTLSGRTYAILSTDAGRVWIEGGSIGKAGYTGSLSLKGTGGAEVTGGAFQGSLDISQARIRGGYFTHNPARWVKGSYRVTYVAEAGVWGVAEVGTTLLPAEEVEKLFAVQLSNGPVVLSVNNLAVGTLSLDDTGAKMLTLDSPHTVVEGATVMLNGQTVATVPSSEVTTYSTLSLAASENLTEKEKAIEANKIVTLLGGAYEVTEDDNGGLILSYSYDFNVEAMTVTPSETVEGAHDITFTLGLYENGEPRKNVTLDKADITVYRNDIPIDTVVASPTFDENGKLVYVFQNVMDDTTEGDAQLFRVHLEQLNK